MGSRYAQRKVQLLGVAGHTRKAGTRSAEGNDYTPAELEFIKSVDAWKKAKRKQFPAATDYLAVALSLGYKKCST